MRLTRVLYKQHLERIKRKHWEIQKNRTIPHMYAEKILKANGVVIEDANEFVKEKFTFERVEIVGNYDMVIPRDKNHPDWKKEVCHVLSKFSPPVEGLIQAQALTKTVHMSESLPDNLEAAAKNDAPETIHALVQRAILSANVYDCEQKKLPRVVNPERPAHIYRREYGITDIRRSLITINKLIGIIERNSELFNERFIAENIEAKVSSLIDGDQIQLQTVSDHLITSRKPLPPIKNPAFTEGIDIPDIHPIRCTLGLRKANFYDFTSVYPIKTDLAAHHPHTSFVYNNKTEVTNFHETEVTENQLKGRSLLHTFTIAASYAKSIHGDDVKDLPKPVTVQSVQSDGRNFQIGVLQLNTLNLNDKNGVKNMWYTLPTLSIFELCQYVRAIPTLEGYNPKVYNYLNALYNNV